MPKTVNKTDETARMVTQLSGLGIPHEQICSMLDISKPTLYKYYDVELLKRVTNKISIPVIASGGVGNLEHLYEGIKKGGASAVLAASIFHYGEYTIQKAKEYLASRGVPVRINQ